MSATKSAIDQLQTAYGMTQEQIARACNCRQTTISALATGKTAQPRYSLGEAIQSLLAEKRNAAAPAMGMRSIPDVQAYADEIDRA